MLSHSLDGRDLAGPMSARLHPAISADAIGVSREELGVVATHSVYGGTHNVTSGCAGGFEPFGIRTPELQGHQPDAAPRRRPLPGQPAPSGHAVTTARSVGKACPAGWALPR
ncbi:hypothetical protein [Arthrobacter sp. P2b]|uniref:hypothetical protein n=1 Tax=unclassified Arthrobacter TaxID=235627 RepID=UPI0034C6761C